MSCPTTLSDTQATFHEQFVGTLGEAGFQPRSVGRTDFGNSVPLVTIRRLMTTCHGAVILGLAQLHVGAGVSRPHTSRAAQVANALLPTPWNHLEAGMAFQLGLPLFVIREDGLTDEGIFGVGVSDRFVHHSDLSPGWLLAPEFTQPFVEWANEVRQHVLYPH